MVYKPWDSLGEKSLASKMFAKKRAPVFLWGFQTDSDLFYKTPLFDS
jgi:hypothetical protein